MSRYVGIIGHPLKHSIAHYFPTGSYGLLSTDIRCEAWETDLKPCQYAWRLAYVSIFRNGFLQAMNGKEAPVDIMFNKAKEILTGGKR